MAMGSARASGAVSKPWLLFRSDLAGDVFGSVSFLPWKNALTRTIKDSLND